MAIGEVKEEITAPGQREVHTCHLSYFSRMTDAETFGDVGASGDATTRSEPGQSRLRRHRWGRLDESALLTCIDLMLCAFWISRMRLSI